MKHAAIPSPDDESDDALSRYVIGLPLCPDIPATDEEVRAIEEASRADIAAGRVHDGAIVGEWIATISLPGFKPFDEWLAERNA